MCFCFELWIPTHPSPPTLQEKVLKMLFFCQCVRVLQSKKIWASNRRELARYDLPTYVLYVSGHLWMFAVQITECVFSLKSSGLLTPTKSPQNFLGGLLKGRRHQLSDQQTPLLQRFCHT